MLDLLIILSGWLSGLFLLWRLPVLTEHEYTSGTYLASADFADSDHAAHDKSADITIIIPARNEERNIGELLRTIRAQQCSAAEVLVVDDSSTDRTAALAAAAGARVIRADALPPGWQGKAWACHTGAEQARSRLLLFLDADTRLAPDALAKLASAYRRHGGMLAVQPYHTVIRPYEQLSAVFNLVVAASMGAATMLGPKMRPSGAFGPCAVCSRDDYVRLGGHGAVRGEVLETFALGRRFQAAGLGLRLFGGQGTVSFRMYPDGLAALAEGWSKNFAGGAVSLRRGLLAAIVLWIAGLAALSVQAVTAGIQFLYTQTLDMQWSFGLVYLLFAITLFKQMRSVGNFNVITAILFPIPVTGFILLFANSVFLTFFRRRVRWKGRTLNTNGKVAETYPGNETTRHE
ncbi:glycosyltransferase [Paenibacillus swuensis]|uniref:glycosyltransferase n=1 Tax=Paenibacillus swuensis TaxID=1178515 RepID=UPI000A63DA7E|nr:glycosyltransferase family 2 protein [Paenibacillus swuensis]